MRPQISLPLAFLMLLNLAACDGVPLAPTTPLTPSNLSNKLGLEEIPYIKDDTYIGNPLSLLGQIVEIRKTNGVCPSGSLSDGATNFNIFPVTGFKVDPKSVVNSPVKRDSQIVTYESAGKVSFLNYLQTELNTQQVFSIILFDQAGARVDDQDPTWITAVNTWVNAHGAAMTDPNICYLWVVKGMIQKNLVRRKFTDVKVAPQGGAYGVNVNGSYHTSSDDYTVDVRFGLSPGIIRRPSGAAGGLGGRAPIQMDPTQSEIEMLKKIIIVQHKQ